MVVSEINRFWGNVAMSEAINAKKVFTWDIHYACNYHCTYCYFDNRWDELSKNNIYPGTEKWINIWNDIYDKYGMCYIHISGGEPFCYPRIMELVAELSKKHKIGFDTNLFFEIKKFIRMIHTPERFGFSSSFHPEFISIAEFIRNANALRSAGFNMKSINIVAYPPHVKYLQEYRAALINEGHIVTILPFRGTFNGKIYPNQYNDVEKENVWRVPTETEPPPADLGSTAKTASSVENRHPPGETMLNWYGGDKKGREGRLCRMGEIYAKIHPDGTAHRCCMTWENWGNLGNLLDGTFSFYGEARPCPYSQCSCSSAMILGEENAWFDHWDNRTR